MTVLCQSSGGLNLSLHLEPSFIDFLVDQRIKQQNALDLSLNQHGVGDSKDPGSEEFLVVNKFMNKCFGSLSVKINSVPSNTNGGIFRNEPQVQPQPFAQKITTQCPNIVVKREVPPNEIRATEFVTIQQPDNGFRIPGVQIAATEVIPARFEARLPTVHDSMAFAAAPFVTEEQPQQQQQQQTTQQNHAMAAIVEQVTQQGISVTQVATHNNNDNTSGYSPAEEPENTSPTDVSNNGNIVVAIGGDQSGKPNSRLSDSAKRKRGRGKKSELGFQFGTGSPGGGGGVCKFSASQASPRKVTSTKTFQCPLCEFSTPYYSSLDVHTKSIHSVERPFSCVLCEYTCKLKGNLKKHYMGIHKLESEPAASLLKHSSQAKEANNSSHSISAQSSSSTNDGSSEDQGAIDASMMDTKAVLQQVAESIHDEAQLQQYKVNSAAPPLVTTTRIETTARVSTAQQQQQSNSRNDDSSYIFQTVSSAPNYVPSNAIPIGTKSDLRTAAPPPILNQAQAPPGLNASSDHTNPGTLNGSGTTMSSSASASTATTLVVVDAQGSGGGVGASMVSSSPPQTTMTSLTSFDPAASNIPDFTSVSASEVPALLMPQGYHATSLETFMPIRMEAHTIDGIEMMGTLDTQSDDENCGLIS